MESDQSKKTKLSEYAEKHHKRRCHCPIVKSASGYFKKHSCIDSKKRKQM